MFLINRDKNEAVSLSKKTFQELKFKERLWVWSFVYICPQIKLLNAKWEEVKVDVDTKFNIIDMGKGSLTVVISFHNLNKLIDYLFR